MRNAKCTFSVFPRFNNYNLCLLAIWSLLETFVDYESERKWAGTLMVYGNGKTKTRM